MRKEIAQKRIESARAAIADLLRDFHYEKIEGEDVEIRLGYIRNQLDIILDDLGEC